MERQTWIAVIVSFFILLGWQKFYVEPRATHPSVSQSGVSTMLSSAGQSPIQGSAQTSGAQTVSGSASAKPSSTVVQEKEVNLGSAKIQLSNQSYFVKDWALKKYKQGLSIKDASVSLSSVTHLDGGVKLAFDAQEFGYLSDVQGELTSQDHQAFWKYEDANVLLTREYRYQEDKPYIEVNVRAQFKAKAPQNAFVSLFSVSPEKDPEEMDRQAVYWSSQDTKRFSVAKTEELKEVTLPVKWIGTTSRYFLLALVSQDAVLPHALLQNAGPRMVRMSLVYPMNQPVFQTSLKVYFGPKDLSVLRSIEPALDHAVDFGWFTIIAYPILRIMQWLYQFVHNYGVAIILLTLMLKVVTYPLTYKSMKSMKEMARVQPQLQKLREKYKDDREALNREMLTLMRSHGYNPMAGCLPMFIQMPVFIALYNVLRTSVELYQAPFALWIVDLSQKDPFYVTPVLLSIVMFVQQKLTPNTAADPAQQKMMQLMPLIFGAFMLTLPSGLTLYMLVNALASIAQQVLLNKKLGNSGVAPVPARARS